MKNVTIPYTSGKGYNYLINLSSIKKQDFLPESVIIEKDIVDIVLELDKKTFGKSNDFGDLYRIAAIIYDFLENNDVILYYYCDIKPVKQRDNRTKISNQEYRSRLFSLMIDRFISADYEKTICKIPDSQNEIHYIHLISKIENSEQVKSLSSALINMGKNS